MGVSCPKLENALGDHFPKGERCFDLENFGNTCYCNRILQVWDARTGQGLAQYMEHQKRAWSVDFSQLDPMKVASGSDDCSIRLWSINEIEKYELLEMRCVAAYIYKKAVRWKQSRGIVKER